MAECIDCKLHEDCCGQRCSKCDIQDKITTHQGEWTKSMSHFASEKNYWKARAQHYEALYRGKSEQLIRFVNRAETAPAVTSLERQLEGYKEEMAEVKPERLRYRKALEQIRDFGWSDERVNVLRHIAREALKGDVTRPGDSKDG